MQKLFFITRFLILSLILLLLTGMISGSSYLHAETLSSDFSSVDVCLSCHHSRSKEQAPKKHAPAPDNHSCSTHFHCHHQPASINAGSLNNLYNRHRLKPVKDNPALDQLAASIFHPPQIHI